jgi:hypothetical protein
MPRLEYRLATESDDPDLRRLLREHPFPGSIQVTFEREPSFFLATPIEGSFHQTAIVRDTDSGQLVAMLSRAIRDVYINGCVQPLGYISQLRIAPAYRALPRAIIRMGKLMEELDRDGRAPLYLISIIEDNLPARRFLTSRLPHLPVLREFARYHTLALYTRRPRRALSLPEPLHFEQGSAEKLPQILDCLERNERRYQLAPCWTSESLCQPDHTPGLHPSDFWLACNKERVVGCVAFWDQSSVKQTVIHRYNGPLGTFRPLINSLSWLTGTPYLPAPRQPFRFGFASHFAADDDDSQVYAALLRQIYNHVVARKDSYLMLGLAEPHPFFPVARREYPHIDYPSQLYLAGWGDIDARIGQIDPRPVGVEAAVL